MSEQYFTRPNVKPVITYIGTTPEQRQMSTDEFKAKFDEMPEAIQQYIKETLLTELDAFKEEFMTHLADYVTDEGGVHGLEVEVGTFTPNLSTTNHDGNATYSGTRSGNYVRIGNLVHVNIRFDVASFTGGTGYYAITGIPFPSFPPNFDRYNYLLAAHNLPGGTGHAWYIINVRITPTNNISGTGAIPAEDFTGTKYIHVTGVYQIA